MAEPNAPATRSRSGDLARVVGGLLVVAVVVGIGLWAERLTDDDLALPGKVAGLAIDDSATARDFTEANSKQLSDAYDDAEAVTARYRSGKVQLVVTAVRARSGPPVPGMFTANEDWVEDGEVTCLVAHPSKRPDTILCQRGSGDLTVRVLSPGSKVLDLDAVVEATNDVWEDVS